MQDDNAPGIQAFQSLRSVPFVRDLYLSTSINLIPSSHRREAPNNPHLCLSTHFCYATNTLSPSLMHSSVLPVPFTASLPSMTHIFSNAASPQPPFSTLITDPNHFAGLCCNSYHSTPHFALLAPAAMSRLGHTALPPPRLINPR